MGAVANEKHVVTLDCVGHGGAMGSGGDERDDEAPAIPFDDDDPEFTRPALPHPLDRLWMHPSELSPFVAESTTRPKPVWTTTLVAGAAGAILTLAALGAVGALGGSSDHVSDSNVVPTSTPIAAKVVAVAVAHSVVAVSAHDRNRTRRGSGVCVHQPGEILTSNRLVGNAVKIDVTTSDGVVHSARVIGRDATTDLALLSIEIATLEKTTPSPFARPASFAVTAPEAGDTAWVVGAPRPGDSSPWMSSGLVASTDSMVTFASGPTTSGLLETAAASSPASSGGALVDGSGDITGIVLAPVGGDRMTYAVPISTALSIASSLRTVGFATHGALGINGIDASDGPTVSKVVMGGPAERAGVRAGDILEEVDGHEVYSMDDVMALVRHDRPGEPLELEVLRGTDRVRLKVILSGVGVK
jgi:putative serine protease PepD